MRCVRICPTKAMTYIDQQPQIVEDECILCGKCYLVCPHDAKKVTDNFPQVKKWLDNNEKVVVSVAPSFVAVWPSFPSLKRILLKKGFFAVEETSVGASLVSQAYAKLMEEHTMKNIITTCCPSVVSLVEKEYGEIVDQLAPIVSPMIAHGRNLKLKYPGCKVVFLSPCIAKQKEIYDDRFLRDVDANISMDELAKWISNDSSDDINDDWEDFTGSIARMYPTPGGIISTLPKSENYKTAHVEGIANIRNVLEAIKNDEVKDCFFELSACDESCLGGPLLTHFKKGKWLGQLVIKDNVDENKKVSKINSYDHIYTKWENKEMEKINFDENAIKDILYLMGKTTRSKEHDCGACGYETCRDKAIAVLEGKADYKLCLPNALEVAESINNIIIDNTPNGIIVLDKDYNIIDINRSAQYLLEIENVDVKDLPIETIMSDEELINLVKKEARSDGTQYLKKYYEMYNKTFNHAIMKIKDKDYTVIILMDITIDETKEKILKDIRSSTVSITQEVIDEQMRAVQEIASLLGETAAKSKVALTKLKKSMEENNE
ncbi:MAG: 4Fe-4S binding protein [Erysipelotrichaceae bacterium]|nr:4Fe-4S binding protein [Erysipelotrichaceae bacterium]